MDVENTGRLMNPFSEQEATALCRWLDNQREFVFLDTVRLDRENYRSLLFVNPRQWLVCQDPEQAGAFLEQVGRLQRQGMFLAGWIGYEFGYLLEASLRRLDRTGHGPYAMLGVFDRPLIIDHRQQEHPARPWSAMESAPLPPVPLTDIRTSVGKNDYLEGVGRIKEYIRAGDTYQVNYTMKLTFACGPDSAAALYAGLRRNQAVSYGAWIRRQGRDIMSFSPELFFRADDQKVMVRPMKGTMSRGRTLAEDISRRGMLRHDEKNRSENVMIVDLLRNDLGRLLHNQGGGQVCPESLFDVEVYETLLQMTSTISGIPARKGLPLFSSLLRALFPCGSVTGAPKIRTMEIIRELEKEPRGVYCGAVGFCGPAEAVFNVPIRTVVLENGRGEMGIGSGIVDDSDPEAEWAESLLKAGFLTVPRPDFQLIETLLWLPDTGYWLLREHLERLDDSANYFLFQHDQDRIRQTLEAAAAEFTAPMRVRLLLHRDGKVTVTAGEHVGRPAMPPDQPPAGEPLPRVMISAKRTDRTDMHLYHKTTCRSLYDTERREALAKGFHEVLFLNSEGEATEGSISNVFIRRGGRLLTPPVACGLLAGTCRRHLLEKGLAVEAVFALRDLQAAEAVFVANSVRGLVQVAIPEFESSGR